MWTNARAAQALAVVAHGAGAGMGHPFLAGVAEGLAADGVTTLRFDFPYMQEGRRHPDRPSVLLESWRTALRAAQDRVGEPSGLPVVAGGKSLGGRMASMVAAEEGKRFGADALVFFGYPLHPPGKPDQLRDAHLSEVRVPMLFMQGTADPFARFDLLQRVVARLGSRARLHVIDGGDHSLRVRGKRRGDAEIGREAGSVAAQFIREVAG
jgi:predicted alpha/beta-hydrolase family hydrolase